MNIHEHQAKGLFAQYGVPTLKGIVAFSADEAVQKLDETFPNSPLWVVKAQIHAGGRGKAGGVLLAKSRDDVKSHAEKLLGSTLVTHQTGAEGQKVRRIFVEDGCQIDREIYLAITLNRNTSKLSIIASAEGGVDIEEVAEKTPEKIFNLSVDPLLGVKGYHAQILADKLNFSPAVSKQFKKLLINLYRLYVEKDAELVEINPLVVTKDDQLIALDGKMSFDGNALFRHSDIQELRDEHEEDESEVEAKEYDLNYIKLDGSIGCMINGAGLAMATMDIIKHYGSEPANFLDVGGGATKERVSKAFQIILKDPNVKAILINIFGGIMRCDVIAEGIVSAASEANIHVPLVVRLQGTKEKEGKEILSKSNLNIISVDDLGKAAEQVVSKSREAA